LLGGALAIKLGKLYLNRLIKQLPHQKKSVEEPGELLGWLSAILVKGASR
jgi:hypothetical protein